MWMITDRGFYSVVDKGDREGYLCIRARVKVDLEALFELEPMASYADSIAESEFGDYRFRVYVRRADWVLAAALLAEEIDYSNFKNQVYAMQGPKRAYVYSEVWSDLYELQRT